MAGAADRFRAAAAAGRVAVDALGLRPTTVAIVVETWSADLGIAGATLVSTATTTLSPTPKVEVTGEGPLSAFGDDSYSGADAIATATQVRIGPITPAYAGGGYDPATLVPQTASPATRAYALLTGPGLDPGGVKFLIDRADVSKALSYYLYCTRTQQ